MDPYNLQDTAFGQHIAESKWRDLPRCEVCGRSPDDGHDPFIHAEERRAQYYAQFEPPEREDYPDDPGEDAVCARCHDVGVCWNVEIPDGNGGWLTICTECERPEDWPPEEE